MSVVARWVVPAPSALHGWVIRPRLLFIQKRMSVVARWVVPAPSALHGWVIRPGFSSSKKG